jgi:hypothetical protein
MDRGGDFPYAQDRNTHARRLQPFSVMDSEEESMRKRGKVLRDPCAGPGLVMIEGQQYRFSLEGIWKSESPPKPGVVVHVDLDRNFKIVAITAVSESQLEKEQQEAAREKERVSLAKLFAKFGAANMAAAGLLVLGWFFLTSLSIQIPVFGKLEFTFWQILSLLHSNSAFAAMERGVRPSTGIYGLLALVTLAAGLVHHFWQDKRVALAGLAPLIFMGIIAMMSRSEIESGPGADLGGAYREVARQARSEAVGGLSFGAGAYLSILVGIYFAAVAIKQFLAIQAREKQGEGSARPASM